MEGNRGSEGMEEKKSISLDKSSPRDIAKRVIRHEADALKHLADSLDETFDQAVEALLNCRGRVVVCGVGKSGIIARKISATLLSTGTPALFLHPTEGVHGDLGAILPDDIVVLISNSGESSETLNVIPAIKAIGVVLIAITGKPESTMACSADLVLTCYVAREADELNLIPTASTSAQLALGDALAIALLEQRGENADDMARRHPAGAIGRRLTLKVSDLMHKAPDDPRVRSGGTFREALFELTGKRLGAVSVVEDNGQLLGIITDGDIKRLLEIAEKEKRSIDSLMDTAVEKMMIRDPKRIPENILGTDALHYMDEHQISQIPVVDNTGKVVGMLRLLDLVRAGL
jgi:arabinose-5-phosphate isomerase